jgi:branched-chain amino acid transport system ATP-binding protein
MADPLLQLEGIAAFYGGVQALRDVSLRVDRGEICALLGANGAGKTTTLACVAGIHPVRRGAITFGDRRIETTGSHDRVRAGVTLVPEGRRVFPRLSVRDNLRCGALADPRRDGLEGRIERVYELFPRLRERARQAAGTLSGGEQQMLAIGRALIAEPSLLLLDEPSLGLAPRVAADIFATIRELNQDGVTVLLVEQNARAALALAARAYILQLGRVVLEGDSAELRSSDEVKRAYLGG